MAYFKKLLISASVAILLASTATAALAWDVAAMNDTINQTNFTVNKGCSGTLISVKDRYVLTANHCVADQYELVDRETVGNDGVIKTEKVRRLRDGAVTQAQFQGAESVSATTYKVRVVAVDSDRDLALVQVLGDLPNTQAAQLACVDPVRGEKVFIVGNPGSVLDNSVVTGIVSSTQRSYGSIGFDREATENIKQPLTQISGGIIGGNSGGAVYDGNGKLIGVPVLGNRTNETFGFAVPLATIKSFLKDNKIDEALYVCPAAKAGG